MTTSSAKVGGKTRWALAASMLLSTALAVDNGVGVQPAMGWNSWNHYACNISETLIKSTADALVSTGLRDIGYNYLNLDDCWALNRTANGTIVADPAAFPSGMRALGDYIHARGLRYGIYTDLGTKTCAGRPGSLGHEAQDAATYAAWGVDYVKVDNCNNNGISPQERYPVMGRALNATGRPILFSMCEWGVNDPWLWAPKIANSWRTTKDRKDDWVSFLRILQESAPITSFSAPGGFNDPDMLEVGNGGMTTVQYRTSFTMWCILKAPLLIGTNILAMSTDTRQILMNKALIAVNQDPLGRSASLVWAKNLDMGQLWAGPLEHGDIVAVLANLGPISMELSLNFVADLGVSCASGCQVTDLWTGDRNVVTGSGLNATLNAYGVYATRISGGGKQP
jgi:alpha-galactosidase